MSPDCKGKRVTHDMVSKIAICLVTVQGSLCLHVLGACCPLSEHKICCWAARHTNAQLVI